MKLKTCAGILFLMVLSTIAFQASGQDALRFSVDVDQPRFDIQPTMWGLFFEDINFAADGGLYAELVKNRSFEFPKPTEAWEVVGANFFSSPLQIVNRQEHPTNPRVARIRVAGEACLINEGFRGMGIREGEPYRFSLQMAVPEGAVDVRAALLGSDGSELGNVTLRAEGAGWQSLEGEFRATGSDAKARLKVCFLGQGLVEADMISLFPVNTWKQRRNGMRADLVQMLADMEPGFLRFPGGCIVEGRDLEKRYRWKNTVGDIGIRELVINRWNDENTRLTPDYFQTFGLGFYEYFLLSEDLGAEPVPILNCGMACQFNSAEVVAMEDMEPYVQDALDLIEFTNGAADTKWGGLRAEMGHPEPFGMTFLGIGNEQWGPQYFERYALFEEALGKAHPEIRLISTTGPMAGGPLFEYSAEALKDFHPALVDEHYYNTPQWFYDNVGRYDDYDRSSYKIFAGEYAAASVGMANPENRNVWETALAEAAFMTGLERNADVVHMASYAPLLAHAEAWQWTPDLIWFDNLRVVGTPNYQVQKLYATHAGTRGLALERTDGGGNGQDGIFSSAVWDEKEQALILKLVNRNAGTVPVTVALDTRKRFAGVAGVQVLRCDDLQAENSLDDPEHIAPVGSEIKAGRKQLALELAPRSLTVITLPQQH